MEETGLVYSQCIFHSRNNVSDMRPFFGLPRRKGASGFCGRKLLHPGLWSPGAGPVLGCEWEGGAGGEWIERVGGNEEMV